MKFKMVFGETHLSDCTYGQPDGYDDYINECDCIDEEEMKAIKEYRYVQSK